MSRRCTRRSSNRWPPWDAGWRGAIRATPCMTRKRGTSGAPRHGRPEATASSASSTPPRAMCWAAWASTRSIASITSPTWATGFARAAPAPASPRPPPASLRASVSRTSGSRESRSSCCRITARAGASPKRSGRSTRALPAAGSNSGTRRATRRCIRWCEATFRTVRRARGRTGAGFAIRPPTGVR